MKLRLDYDTPRTFALAHRWLIGRLARSFEAYHPVTLDGAELAAGERACVDRWGHIAEVIRQESARSLLDLGCAEGYFVQQAARQGCFAVGVDADVRRLTVAQNVSLINRTNPAGFVYGLLSPELIDRMPQFDVVLCLSVLHHVMYERGVEHAREFMSAVRRATGRRLIFDMGQSNETRHPWASRLPEMTPDPAAWIAEFLRSCGFSRAEVIGQTDAYKQSAARFLFSAWP